MTDHDNKTEVTNTPQNPVPVQQVQPAPYQYPLPTGQAGDAARMWMNIGPMGVLGVIAFIAFGFMMTVFFFMLREGQASSKTSQDHLFKQLEAEQKTSSAREEKLIDRADKLNTAQSERWEKSRERSESLAADIRAMGTKMDMLSSEVKAIALVLKLAPKENK